mmetsp:Transcript_50037/g.93061  ORF Transcript_50037/g.93061 Transcript_50037/m.93061 type:complete len:198 (-) Transcript_50037:100-693(-)
MVKKSCWKKGSLSNTTSKGGFKRAVTDPSIWSSDMKGQKRGRWKGGGTGSPKEDNDVDETEIGESAIDEGTVEDETTIELQDAKKQKTQGEGGCEGGWSKPAKQRERGSEGVEEKESYKCKLCRKELPPDSFNAKRLNGVRRGWVQLEELACKDCNASLAQILAPSLKLGGPLARAKRVEKAQKKAAKIGTISTPNV